MVMDYMKMINDLQEKVTHVCNNAKEKLHKTNAAILFNNHTF
jgi:hypothetical protein